MELVPEVVPDPNPNAPNPSISIPINLSINIENIKRIRPLIAEVKSSCPAFSLSGFPEAVIIINPAYRIRRNAIPPPIPTAHLNMSDKNSSEEPNTWMHPIAV
jgi:hypothetical protein